MMLRRACVRLSAVVLLAGVPVVAAAQTSIIPTAGLGSMSSFGTSGVRCAADARFAVTGSGEGLNQDRAFQSPTTANAAHHGPTLSIDAVGEAAWYHSRFGSITTLLGGPRVVFLRAHKVSVFADGLVGLLHEGGFNDFALQPRAGVFIPLKDKKFQLVGQVQFPIDFFDGGHETGKSFDVGVAIPLRRL